MTLNRSLYKKNYSLDVWGELKVCGKKSIYSTTTECLIGDSNYSCLTSMDATPLCLKAYSSTTAIAIFLMCMKKAWSFACVFYYFLFVGVKEKDLQ